MSTPTSDQLQDVSSKLFDLHLLKGVNDQIAALLATTGLNNVGSGAYQQYGSLSAGSDGVLAFTNIFVPDGERVSVFLEYYATGAKAINWSGGGGKVWLEQDPSGGVNYVPVQGTVMLFSAMERPTGSSNLLLQWNSVRPFGAWRIVINFGALQGGATGDLVGFNAFVLK